MADESVVHRDVGALVDMMENAGLAIERVGGRGWEAFAADATVQDAVIYRLGVVGEAARLVSEETRVQLPDIPWRKVNAMRNILIHDYKGVELPHVWDVVQNHAPAMIQIIRAFLNAKGIKRPDTPLPPE